LKISVLSFTGFFWKEELEYGRIFQEEMNLPDGFLSSDSSLPTQHKTRASHHSGLSISTTANRFPNLLYIFL